MSHTVTVTRTTTTTTTSAILLNIGYFKTIPGLLKLLHIILGVICVSIVGHYIAYHSQMHVYRANMNPNPRDYHYYIPDHGLFLPELFFLLIATTCLIASTLLLISCIISIATATILPKTVVEIVYHSVAMFLLMIASIIYIVDIEKEYKMNNTAYKLRLTAGEITFFPPLTFLYFVASLNFLCSTAARSRQFISGTHGYGLFIFVSILGIVNSILYGVAVFFAYRNFRSG